ncbi:hypothetical protein ABO04_10225 [Nitrosomonas sp. HPC101]|uniref:DUF6733 family protein n=1 Tax=Nitrosomonas sp. HPC101 TaxID=1658667 RepID=UPI00136B9ECE|nr:DUF6733 family protein [Nitrosomonas sp. HPC101]MXS86264.1 hypothetical protein [Nitrosomonas sp. HPC101]
MKKQIAGLVFSGLACTAINVSAEEDRELRQKVEALEAKIADLEGRSKNEEHDDSHGFDSHKFHGGITLKQDNFFGFQTIVDAGYEVADNIDFMFYAWLWTNPNFGKSSVVTVDSSGNENNVGGQGLWTEFGIGLNFRFFDNTLSVNPNIGMLNGSLLSSRVIGKDIRAGEGVVPNLVVNYDNDYVTANLYVAYYLATRGPRARDFLHNWISVGVKPALFGFDKVLPINSVGIHWEHLWAAKNRIDSSLEGVVYNWVGPYIEFGLPKNLALRFAGGFDVKDDVSSNFYQASIKLDF